MAKRKPRKKGQKRNSKKHSDLYTDENPKGTIHGLKFATVKDSEASVRKIKRSNRSHNHKTQAAIAMEQRAEAAGKKSSAGVYRKFIEQQKKKTKALRESVRELIREAMIKPSAISNKFAIWTDLGDTPSTSPGQKIEFVMYDTLLAKNNIDSLSQQRGEIDAEDIKTAIHGTNIIPGPYVILDQDPIVAVMRVEVSDSGNGNCNNAWQVIRSAAQEGYGPTLYDLVMSISPNGLIPDRASVSREARDVWDFYANQRPEVQKKFLDPAEITLDTEDDCDGYEEDGISLQVAQRSMNIDYFESEWPYEWSMFLDLAEEDLVSYVMTSDSVDFFYNVSEWITNNSEKIESPSWNEKEAEELWEKFTEAKEGNLVYYLDRRDRIREPDYLDFSYNTNYAADEYDEMTSNHYGFLTYVMDEIPSGTQAYYDFESDNTTLLHSTVGAFFESLYAPR